MNIRNIAFIFGLFVIVIVIFALCFFFKQPSSTMSDYKKTHKLAKPNKENIYSGRKHTKIMKYR